MRKVYAKVKATVLVPIQVELRVIVQLDEGIGATNDRITRLIRHAHSIKGASLEDVEVSKIISVNGNADCDLSEPVQDILEKSGAHTISGIIIDDSK